MGDAMLKKISKHGDSLVVLLPKKLCWLYNWKENEYVNVEVNSDQIIITRFKHD